MVWYEKVTRDQGNTLRSHWRRNHTGSTPLCLAASASYPEHASQPLLVSDRACFSQPCRSDGLTIERAFATVDGSRRRRALHAALGVGFRWVSSAVS